MNNDNNNNGDGIAKCEKPIENIAILDKDVGTFKREVKLANVNPTWKEIQAAQAALGIFGRGNRKGRK